MHKTIFSRFLWVGGARVSTVGLGVILAVMLGFAATTTATPAAAQNVPDLPNVTNLAQEPDQVLEHRVPTNNDITDSQPYRVPVETLWREDASQVFQTWTRGNCGGTPPHVHIERQSGLQPFKLVFQGALLDQPRTEYVDSSTVHRYRLTVQCESSSGALRMGSMLGAPFWIQVIEDPPKPSPLGPSLGYVGNWVQSSSGFPSRGTTHEATQKGDAAILKHNWMTVSWVTTLDDSSTPARVVCDEQKDPQGNFIPCAKVNTDDPTPGVTDRNQVVAWTSAKWDQKGGESGHTVRIISDDSSIGSDNVVDVDAFIIVHRWP